MIRSKSLAQDMAKKYEALLSCEEMLVAEDFGKYFRVPADDRDLNYEMYVEEGSKAPEGVDYNSDNTEQLSVDGMIDLLLSLDVVQATKREFEEMNGKRK